MQPRYLVDSADIGFQSDIREEELTQLIKPREDGRRPDLQSCAWRRAVSWLNADGSLIVMMGEFGALSIKVKVLISPFDSSSERLGL